MLRYCYSHVILFLFTLLCINAYSSSPNDEDFIYYNLNFLAGRMTPHYQSQAILNKDYIKGVDLNAYFLSNEKSSVSTTVLGLGYFFSNLGNDDVYGFVHSTYFSLLMPISTGKYPLRFKIGLGPGYATKKFDNEENILNESIGSHLNAFGQIALSGGFPIVNGRLMLRLGMSFNHISNGLVVDPNQGINTFTIHAGVDIPSNHKHNGVLSIGHEMDKEGKNRFAFTGAIGIKQAGRTADEQILTSSLIFDYGYRIVPAFSMGFALNLFYNDTWANYPYNVAGNENAPIPYQSALQLALELDKSPISIILHPGFYIYKPSDKTPDFTGRLGVRYSFKNNITLQFAIKHHWFALADYFEWGIGYKFYK